MITTIKQHTFLPLPPACTNTSQLKKKISIPNFILSRKTMAEPLIFKHPFSPRQKLKHF